MAPLLPLTLTFFPPPLPKCSLSLIKDESVSVWVRPEHYSIILASFCVFVVAAVLR